MNIVCKNWGKAFNLSQNDEYKIKTLSTPNTFRVKLEDFLCEKCLDKEYVGETNPIRKNREMLNLDVDKY